jgi:hypothetical protein
MISAKWLHKQYIFPWIIALDQKGGLHCFNHEVIQLRLCAALYSAKIWYRSSWKVAY